MAAQPNTVQYVPPVNVFDGQRDADRPKLERREAELRNAKLLVRSLRSAAAVVLRQIRKPLVKKVIARLERIVDDPAATAIEIAYAAEVIHRLLNTTGQIAAQYGVDDFARVAKQIQQNKRALQAADAKIKRSELRAARRKKESIELAEKLRPLADALDEGA